MDVTVEGLLDLIDDGRVHEAIEEVLGLLREGSSVSQVIEEVLAPAQRTVGRRWHAARYSVADEHRVSAVIEDVLGLLVLDTERPTAEGTLALASAEGEWHVTPARMAALCLRDAGWRVQFLGPSMPADHLASALEQIEPEAVAISCTLPLALPGVAALADAAHRHGVPVMVGGTAFSAKPRRAERLGADRYVRHVRDAAATLDGWVASRPELNAGRGDARVDAERVALTEQRSQLVDELVGRLEARIPEVGAFDERQRRHTREDLGHILDALGVAVLVDDPDVFVDLVAWLGGLLAARGVPGSVFERSLAVMVETIPDDLPVTRSIVELGHSQLVA